MRKTKFIDGPTTEYYYIFRSIVSVVTIINSVINRYDATVIILVVMNLVALRRVNSVGSQKLITENYY